MIIYYNLGRKQLKYFFTGTLWDLIVVLKFRSIVMHHSTSTFHLNKQDIFNSSHSGMSTWQKSMTEHFCWLKQSMHMTIQAQLSVGHVSWVLKRRSRPQSFHILSSPGEVLSLVYTTGLSFLPMVYLSPQNSALGMLESKGDRKGERWSIMPISVCLEAGPLCPSTPTTSNMFKRRKGNAQYNNLLSTNKVLRIYRIPI